MILKNIFCLNEQGHRETQEDNIYPNPGTAVITDKLFIVCDGVGGNSHGEVASRIACEGIAEFISAMPARSVNDRQILAAIYHAKDLLQQFVVQCPNAKFMGTTLTIAYLMNNGIWTAWCGDSRIYHIRNGQVLWQSKDHSLVQQLIDDGEITKEEARSHPQRNIILHSLSAAANSFMNIDRHFIESVEPDDYIMLCTDGMLENVDETELMEILGNKQKVTDKQSLFLDYCEGKTYDNFSMYLFQIGDLAANPIDRGGSLDDILPFL